jgi:glycosyltransferase involved in cell wall biosynthesis
MKKIYVATKARGFLTGLFNSQLNDIEFSYDQSKLYETSSKIKLILSKLVKSKLADHIGLIQRIKIKNEFCEIAFSYNRFLKSQKDYVIYLENPLALVHYSTDRNKTIISRIKLKNYFNDPHLKSIVCLSNACFETVNKFYSIPNRIKLEQIYPLVYRNELTSKESIKNKSHKEYIQCLYISSNFILKGGKDILHCFKRLSNHGINNIKLKIITRIDSLDNVSMKEINQNVNIELHDFTLNKEELNKIYNASCILLNPTRQDSFSLVVLEAMKAGNTIISTDLYAIPEMVENDYNGYLTNPKYRFFNYDNLPNNEVWNNRTSTIYSDYIDEEIVDFLYGKLIYLNKNRNQLERLSKNSFIKATSEKFSEDYIKAKWEGIIRNL